MFVCDQHIILFWRCLARVCLQLANPLLLSFHDSPSFVIFSDCCRFELKRYHQQKVYFLQNLNLVSRLQI